MPLAQGNYEVQTLAPHCSNDAFANGIRHRHSHWCFNHVQPHMTHALVNVFGEDSISVVDEHAIGVVSRYRFAELLHGPLRCGISCDIDVKESAAGMLDDHKHIEHAEGRCDHHTEVTCHDASGVIADKRGPALRQAAFVWTAYAVVRHVLAHCSRRDAQAEFEQEFVGDAFLTPDRIF